MGKLPDLKIGKVIINPPIIQGGMGVRVSLHNLTSAVSNEGALGVIASVGLGEENGYKTFSYEERSARALKDIISETRKRTDRPFGVNIMYALTNYNHLVQVCLDEKVAIIFSGAGLPLKLPALAEGYDTALVPIVSSGRAADIICKTWLRKYNKLPDGFVIEGPLAGGHLGFSIEELADMDDSALDKILDEVMEVVRPYSKLIPVVVGGGIFDGRDIAHFLNRGASGVQLATRFIATYECDASDNFKKAVINSKKDDVIIINSPVKMPGRVINNEFLKKIALGKKVDFECKYKCLKSCEPEKTIYCIAKALVNAYRGDLERGFVMAGANCYRVNKMVSVKELIDELAEEAKKFYTGESKIERSYSIRR